MSIEIKHCCVCGRPIKPVKLNAANAAQLSSPKVVAGVTPVCTNCVKKQKYK